MMKAASPRRVSREFALQGLYQWIYTGATASVVLRILSEMDIPGGFHVHSNRPLEKFLIATQLKVEAPAGVRVSAVSYPRAILRSLKFSKNRVAVFEGRATMRFNVTVPANFGSDSAQLKATLRYQSCNDELCFPPQTRDVWINVKVK
jgi:hypothetical protein